MDAKQVSKTFAKLGLGPTAISKLLQVTRMTVWQWRQDGTTGANAVLLKLLASGKITIQDVEQAHD